MENINTGELYLVYMDSEGERHYQPWQDIVDSGTLTEPDGGDMEVIGWVTGERRKRLAKAMRRAKKRRSRLPKREDQGDLSGLVSELEVAKKSIASATEMVL